MREGNAEVLVVGAGPVGLWTALLLAEAGVETSIIDAEERTTARSYACALHAKTLASFQRLGLAEACLAQGRRVQRIVFYNGEARQAELNLADLGGEYPFLLILPQNVLESLLEQRLRKAGVVVHWNHRFDGLLEEESHVTATIEELEGTSTGYIVPHWEMVVKNRAALQAQFLIGADGHNSLVRQRLGLLFQRVSDAEFFAAYEFETESNVPDEVQVVLHENTTNVLWPLSEKKCRWTFQLSRSEEPGEFPEKERRAAHVAQPNIDERIRQYVERVAQRRAPWFAAGVKAITWCTEVAFQSRLVHHFGRSRCWLAGDAAHQTGPVGVQSMNVGFLEGERLASTLKQILHEASPMELLAVYQRERHLEWERLLGLTGGLDTNSQTPPWVGDQRARILPCLPASGADLARLAGQLSLDFSSK